MNKIKYLLLSAFLVVFSTSCDDALDIIQDGELDDKATFQTTQDLYKYLQGSVYASISNTNEIMISSVFTDEIGIGPSNGGQEIDFHRFNLNQSNGYVTSLWGTHYSTINRVNRLLEAAEGIVPSADACFSVTVDEDGNDVCHTEVEAYYSILAQARALRAYAYVQLSSYFSTDMSDDNALGVVYIDYVPTIDEKLPRVNNGVIFDLINNDLAFAKDNLGDVVKLFLEEDEVSAYKYVNVNFINALNARFNLYRKNYDLAKHYADLVINTSGLSLTLGVPFSIGSLHSETTTNPYRRIWADLSQGEVLFASARNVGGIGGDVAGNFFFNNTSFEGGAYLDMGRNLYNSLASVNTDIRFHAFVDPTTQLDASYLTSPNYINTDAIIIDKYPGKGTAVLRNDLKLFRLSEMFMIKAEVAAHNGNFNEVSSIIKRITDARNVTSSGPAAPVLSNATAAFGAIMDQKRKEFCFEGHRFLDIKRLGVLANKSVDRNITDDIIKTLPTTISNQDYRFTLPIPQAEVSANNTIIQNPGY